MKRISSLRLRSASMMPLMPSPGRPKMTSTPQSWIVSTRISAAVIAMIESFRHTSVGSMVVSNLVIEALQTQAIVLAALEAAPKGVSSINFRMELPQKSQDFIVVLAAHWPMEGRFEPEPKLLLVLIKVAPFSDVMLHLRVTRADPPLLPRRIDAFRVMAIQDLARQLCLFAVIGENNHHRPALLQRVFVNKDFVLRQPVGQ